MERNLVQQEILSRLEELEAIRHRFHLVYRDGSGLRRKTDSRVLRLERDAGDPEGVAVLLESGERVPLAAVEQVDGWPEEGLC